MTREFYRQGQDLIDAKTGQRITTQEFGIGTPNAGAGFKEIQKGGGASGSSGSTIKTVINPIQDLKNHSQFIDAAKQIIRNKQGMNKDIQQQRGYWRTIARDATPFGGPVDPAREYEGRFTDEEFRQMDPGQQASVRLSRMGAAQAHLQGLGEEERYRGATMSDTLNELNSMYDQRMDLYNIEKEEERYQEDLKMRKAAAEQARIKNLASTGNYDEDGWPILDLDAKTIADAMKQIESGGNYASKGAAGEGGAYQYMPATWDAYSRAYAAAVLNKSVSTLPFTKENQDAVTIWKVQQWLDQGYSPLQIVSMWNAGGGRPNAYKENWRKEVNGKVIFDTPAHVRKFINALPANAVGSNTMPKPIYNFKDYEVAELMSYTGLSSNELKNQFTQTELKYLQDRMKSETTSSIKSEIIKTAMAEAEKMVEDGATTEKIKGHLNLKYQGKLNVTDVNSIIAMLELR